MLNESRDSIIDVNTGEVKVSSGQVILRALALGSCVAVVAYDRINKIGGIAHVMLPGKSSKAAENRGAKYAEDGIEFLLSSIRNLSPDSADIEINLIGGSNVLGEGNIAEEVVSSVTEYIESRGLAPKNRVTGGDAYRSVSLDVGSGEIFYCTGSNEERPL
jgi:chemotaxis protein CheD